MRERKKVIGYPHGKSESPALHAVLKECRPERSEAEPKDLYMQPDREIPRQARDDKADSG